jgi:enoyl-[acyl-carrier protein] reductase II
LICNTVSIPVIAAGGIGSGQAMAAALCLGAQGVQVGSRFVATVESSAHQNFKQTVVDAGDGATELTLKELTPVRLIKNAFYEEVQDAYAQNFSKEQLLELLGRGRAKKGMFEGDLVNGELEIGQVSAIINEITTAESVVKELVEDCKKILIQTAAGFNFG